MNLVSDGANRHLQLGLEAVIKTPYVIEKKNIERTSQAN